MKIIKYIFAAAFVGLFAMCGTPKLPSDAVGVNEQVAIYPDYAGVTIPANIAPMNFQILDSASGYVTHAHAKGQQGIVAAGKTVDFDIKKWNDLLQNCAGDTILIDVYTRLDGKWRQHPVIRMFVAEEIDPYISYRQIEPSYIGFEVMRINQRCLQNFDEKEIFNNCNVSADESGQCINCHSYQDYNRTGNMQMHVRINHGGTVIAHEGNVQKVNLKTDKTISAGVYPAWHKTLPIIAYSNNTTTQNFHSTHPNKIEVQDGESDLILYNVATNEVSIIANDSTELETFPYWSADGKYLYYVSSKTPVFHNEDSLSMYKAEKYRDYKYNIYKKPFDAETLTFGPTDTVYMASEHGASATFPRESPDGRYLLFTMAPYGTFHIWHKQADLFLLDLQTNTLRSMDEVNSDDVESYHSWSSNGKWIIFSSRREDGSYTRLYLTHFDEKGRGSKPFIIPQRDPDHNRQLFKSYNIPEFMVEPVNVTRQQLMDAITSDPLQAVVKEG